MSLRDITREAVLAAVEEHDALGAERFLGSYGFGPAEGYFLVVNGRRYASKAIVGVAHKYVVPAKPALKPSDFSGGALTVARLLRRLGLSVEGPDAHQRALPDLTSGRTYSWDELGAAFQFSPSLFQVGGGMLSRPEFNALLLITHPGGARSFDYEDRWEGDTLVYTGRGKTGDQKLDGPNRDVAENRKRLVVLEAAGSRRLRFLGVATCLDSWLARATDSAGRDRNVWKFRLALEDHAKGPDAPLERLERSIIRRPRPFSSPEPAARKAAAEWRRSTPEETSARQEKASLGHHRMVARLVELLVAAGWTDVEEIPAAVDLWGTGPGDLGRVVFEVKTLSGANHVHQCRAALAQLMEYRFFFGRDSDRLCLVVDGPIPDRRRALLEAFGVAVMQIAIGGSATLIGPLAAQYFGRSPFLVQGSDAQNQ